jgi:hypothetical protein
MFSFRKAFHRLEHSGIGTPLDASTTIATAIKHRKFGVVIELLESGRELNTSANTDMRQVVSNFDRSLDPRK